MSNNTNPDAIKPPMIVFVEQCVELGDYDTDKVSDDQFLTAMKSFNEDFEEFTDELLQLLLSMALDHFLRTIDDDDDYTISKAGELRYIGDKVNGGSPKGGYRGLKLKGDCVS